MVGRARGYTHDPFDGHPHRLRYAGSLRGLKFFVCRDCGITFAKNLPIHKSRVHGHMARVKGGDKVSVKIKMKRAYA